MSASVEDLALSDFVTEIYIEEPPPIIFTGHNKYMLSVAKLCRNEGLYTDVILRCSDGEFSAHKLVLASTSALFKQMLIENPDDVTNITLSEFSQEVVAAVLDYVYTGKLILSVENAPDIYSLITSLGIEQDNVSLEKLEPNSTNPVTKLKVIRKSVIPDKMTEKEKGRTAGTKRRASYEGNQSSSKRQKENSTTALTPAPVQPSTAAKRSRKSKPTDPEEVPFGFHDMSRTDTWVCAICEYYDPPVDDSAVPMTTDWIGCDCNRWYHKHCTKLEEVDDSFSCKDVNLKCLTT